MQKPKNIPEDPGVYQFKDGEGKVIYVGKAKNLKNRLNSYFSNQLLPKTRQMVATATKVDFIKVQSEFEALLLEANLVKKYQPKYNIELKDDKSPLYIGITKDKYPRIITFRKTQFDDTDLNLKEYFGPYLSGIAARGILRRIRRIYHFSTHLPQTRICIYKQIGLCDPCPSEIENESDLVKKRGLRRKYLKNVRGVKKILSGKINLLSSELEKEIKDLSKKERFEEAQEVSVQLGALYNLAYNKESDVEEYLKDPNLIEDIRDREAQSLRKQLIKYYPNLEKINRIECFDIAHLAGSFPTASMVTFVHGEADKRYYRHFKVNQKKGNSDVDSMREIITRRLTHLEDWGKPDLIIIDGGKPQLSAVGDLLENENIAYFGLAKQFETIVIKQGSEFIEQRAGGAGLRLIQRMRDEAHRFARRLHHKQIKNNLFETSS
jgi:excinuclease ABC subunit C